MQPSKTDIIARLQKELLHLQGHKNSLYDALPSFDLGPMKKAFPNAVFPAGAIHEFFCFGMEDMAVTNGFIAVLLAALMHNNGAVIWIGKNRNVFPPSLVSFGIAAEKIIFIDLQKEKDILWTTEEALKCEGITAVIAEIQELGFTSSRRLQLAVEQSRVTGFIIRPHPRNLATACIARWKISSLESVQEDGLPGVGFPSWNIELLKIRNGKPGEWQVVWAVDHFRYISKTIIHIPAQQKKTG